MTDKTSVRKLPQGNNLNYGLWKGCEWDKIGSAFWRDIQTMQIEERVERVALGRTKFTPSSNQPILYRFEKGIRHGWVRRSPVQSILAGLVVGRAKSRVYAMFVGKPAGHVQTRMVRVRGEKAPGDTAGSSAKTTRPIWRRTTVFPGIRQTRLSSGVHVSQKRRCPRFDGRVWTIVRSNNQSVSCTHVRGV